LGLIAPLHPQSRAEIYEPATANGIISAAPGSSRRARAARNCTYHATSVMAFSRVLSDT